MRQLLIIGAGGHGKVVADIAVRCGYDDIAFLDENESLKSCMGYPVIGKPSSAVSHPDSDYFVAVGNPKLREEIQTHIWESGLRVVTLVHSEAVVAKSADMGTGTVVMAGAIINPDACIGNGCIINTGASVDHDNVIEDYVHVSVGSHIAGEVHIGKSTWIGAGAVISNSVKICGECMIGAGAVVVEDIVEPGTYVGVPARKIK
ncbi:MAG: acetyltransferase [Muribaculaceae bacterium]|nr:acetyltransferase [Roseburia sp.]MCM1431235.1 acetyltransferase [Muribaculaceae bacterium]MCM1492279.1 acetyltransferase [Muribaculaceae bacterium]